MVRVISLVALICLVSTIDGKAIDEDGSKRNGTSNEEETRRSMATVSRSSIIVDSSHYQPRKNSSSKAGGGAVGLCSGEKDQRRCLVSALSRIARIHVDEDREPRDRKQSFVELYDKKDRAETRNELELSKESRRTCRCNVLRDVYVPEIDKKLPAYVCRLRDRVFVLTSERFLEDRRSSFDIDVDEETSRRLLASGSKEPRTVRTELLPVTLVLKFGEDNYRIRDKSRRSEDENRDSHTR